MMNIITITIPVVCMIATSSTTVAMDWHFSEPNIAFEKNATQSPGFTPASRAVDGNTDSDDSLRSCTHTDTYNDGREYSSWWTVYLEGNYKITGIIIYNRNLYRYRLKDFKIIGQSAISANVTLYDDHGPQKYNDLTIPIPVNDTQLFTSITITVPTFPLALCEVEIFAACRPPTALPNGKYSPVQDGYGFSSVITVTCDNAYMVYGNNQLTCQGDGLWGETEPRCIENKCYNLLDVSNGNYTYNGSAYLSGKQMLGDVITVVCDIGYEHTLGWLQRTCTLHGVSSSNGMYAAWNGTPPTCSLITCPRPITFSGGHYESQTENTDSSNLPYGTVIHATCDNSLYKFIGEINRTCGENGTWSGVAPACEFSSGKCSAYRKICGTALVSTPQSQIQAGPIIGAFIGGIVLTVVVMVIASLLRRRYIAVGTMCCPDKVTTRTDEHEDINDPHATGEYEHRIELESVNRDAENVYAETVPANSNEHVYSDLNTGAENETEVLDSRSDYENVNQ